MPFINNRHVSHLADVFDENGDAITRQARVPFRYRWKSDLKAVLRALLEFVLWLAACLLFAGLIGLALAGCSSDMGFSRPVLGSLARQCVSPTIVYCDPSLDARACAAVQEAIEWWATQVPGRALLLFGGERAVTQLAHGETPPMDQLFVGKTPDNPVLVPGEGVQAALTQFHAFRDTMCRHDALVVQHLQSDLLSDGSLVQMFKHEFGHVLGLPHAEAPGCLMSPVEASDMQESQTSLCESERNLIDALYKRD